MNAKRMQAWSRTAVLWAGLGLMAVIAFGESRMVWRCRDLCARAQAQAPAPSYNPTDWQRH
jgi:hypothetical protein